MAFQLNGETFEEGVSLTITTPELGTIPVTANLQDYSRGLMIGLDLGWIQTALPCRSAQQPQANARLTLYSNGESYNTLHLCYFCGCSYQAHSHYLEWNNLLIDGATISTSNLGQHYRQVHNHPLVAEFAQWKPVPEPVSTPSPAELKTNGYGQIQLF